jgi:hypothetical protein
MIVTRSGQDALPKGFQAPAGARAVAGEVRAEHADLDGRDEDAADFVGGAVLEAAFLAPGSVVGPFGSGAGL